MEEAEALSTKMGIMVTGGVFKCFGSAQHIKNKFGTGYEIEIKIKKVTEPEINEVISQFGLEKESKVPGQGIKLNNLLTLMKDKKVDPFLVSEIKEGGLGNDLVTEDFENGFIDIKSFANWFYIEQAGMNIVNCLTE